MKAKDTGFLYGVYFKSGMLTSQVFYFLFMSVVTSSYSETKVAYKSWAVYVKDLSNIFASRFYSTAS